MKRSICGLSGNSKTVLVCYDLKPPEAFITDNDKALWKALSRVFEEHSTVPLYLAYSAERLPSRQEDLANYAEDSEDRERVKEKHEQCMKDWSGVR